MCQCEVAVERETPCVSNAQCGPSDQCILVSAVGSVSYGTTPCSECPNSNVYCVIQPSGYSGVCSCYTQGTMQQSLCNTGVGLATGVDSNKVCGYSELATSSLTSWRFYMDEIAMISCMQVPLAICSTVWTSSTTSINMAVAVLPIRTSNARRRLLSFDEKMHKYEDVFDNIGEEEVIEALRSPGWELAAQPCKDLVESWESNESLGVLDKQSLRFCGYWRSVGKKLIDLGQLEGFEEHEWFLVSVDDLAMALADKKVLFSLLAKPWILVKAMLYHPVLRPLRAIASVLATTLEERVDAIDIMLNFTKRYIDGIESMEQEELLNITLNSEVLEHTNNFSHRSGRHLLFVEEGEYPARRLLSVIADSEQVQSFTAKIVRGEPSAVLSDIVAQSWGEGPYAWPPKFDYSLQACPAGVILYDSTKDTLTTLIYYYSNWDAPRPQVDRSLRAALPQINLGNGSIASLEGTTWASKAFHLVMSLTGLSPAKLFQYFSGNQPWSLRWLIASITQCDFGATLSCNRQKRGLLMSLLVFVIFYLVLRVVSDALGVPMLATLFFLSGPSFIIWYTYGLGPTCLPMIPACLVEDVLAFVAEVFPERLEIPSLLRSSKGNTTVLKPCRDIGFTGWIDPLSFAVCDVDLISCQWISSLEFPIWMNDTVAPFQDRLQFFAGANETTRPAYRLCTWITWIEVIPFMAFVIGAGALVSSIILGIVEMLPVFLGLVAQVLAFHRVEK